ncbi:MAG: bifunctional (p)ppGpp synthetase/guanosine-3',5'-bis(diphosphate) 3'-pyrophosphohydrolase [Acidobacteriota bacterium]|nr:bifunctional (p)ppGpp synthetase/guanosine-3',5'-bis(diphosphate) 3'-pyrophosphohydrolase [Acidobacteriota bacterium]
MLRFEDILEKVESYHPAVDEALLRRAYVVSAHEHRNQLRSSGEPYLVHPLAVAMTLAEMKLDDASIAAGLLHDVLEDGTVSKERIGELFGADVAHLVDGVTKIGKYAFTSKEAQQAETFRKMLLAMTDDLRVILVKLADRLHNMQTLEHVPEAKQRATAAETLEIYAPLANRLGMGKMKGDLEDLSFRFLHPEEFEALRAAVDERIAASAANVEKIRLDLVAKTKAMGIEAEITGRVKRYWSIRQKLIRQAIPLEQLYDVLAFRVLVDSIPDCYTVLGIVHQSWRPVPGRIKDYIAMPKRNFYQSLHTTLVPEGAPPFEVQIRTREMDLIAENGIAAHWKYKEGKLVRTDARHEEHVGVLRQILETTRDVSDPKEFLSSLRIDLYPDDVYTFSPKGAVYAFSRGATPVDFAYRVHTDVGHHCVGARVNGRLVPLKSPLENGDIVEILTAPSAHPSRDWLAFTVTSRARNKIRAFIHAAEKEQSLEIGRRLLERELKKWKKSLAKLLEAKAFDPLLGDFGAGKVDDLIADVGYGKIAPRALVARLLPETAAPPEGAPKPSRVAAISSVVRRVLPFGAATGIRVKGENDLLATLAKCCQPVPGDDVVGYVTRGRGVSVHATTCPNVRTLLFDPGREIPVEWEKAKNATVTVDLEIRTEDRQGMLARITQVLSAANSNIRSIEARTSRDGNASIEASVTTQDRRHLDRLLVSLRALPGVTDVRRKLRDTDAEAG